MEVTKMCSELFVFQDYVSQETSTILAPNMTALDNLPEDVTGVVRTGVKSIPGDTEGTPTWVYALNTSEVSTE